MRLAWRFLFAACAVLTIATAATAARPGSDIETAVVHLMRANGFRAIAQREPAGDAIHALKFATAACSGPVTIVPISVLLQQLSLLPAPDRSHERMFVYVNRHWRNVEPTDVAPIRLRRVFLDMIRSVPFRNTDDMLYVVAPKNCQALKTVAFERLWESGQAVRPDENARKTPL